MAVYTLCHIICHIFANRGKGVLFTKYKKSDNNL